MRLISKILANVILVFLILMLPFAAAQEAGTEASAYAVAAYKLKFRKFGEAIGDFFFKIKMVFASEDKTKIELLRERNDELKARQELWLETKAQALAQFNTTNMSQEEKKAILEEIQREHRAIIQNHLEITSQIRSIQAETKGNIAIEQKTNAIAETIVKSKLGLGLDIASDTKAGNMLGLIKKFEAKKTSAYGNSDINAQGAIEIAKTQMGIKATEIREESKDGTMFFVVSGIESHSDANIALERNVEVWIEASTGTIASVDVEAHIERRNDVKTEDTAIIEIGKSKEGKADATVKTSDGINIGSDQYAEGDGEAGGKILIMQ